MNKLATEDGALPIAFAGHDSFALRHAWLEKAYREVQKLKGEGNPFSSEDAIVHFGVGKNMVNAIKHWSLASNFIIRTETGYEASRYAKTIMSTYDPYFEKRSTIWKIHYEIAKNPINTTIYWIFSRLNSPSFSRDYLERKLKEYCIENGGRIPATKTIKTDISVALSMYCKGKSGGRNNEDDLSYPLQELNLIRQNQDGTYSIAIGPKKTLSDGLLISAIIEYWAINDPHSSSIRLDTLLYKPNSPGRIFALSETELIQRISKISKNTNGMLEASETAGVYQIFRNQEKFNELALRNAWQNE